jgi:chromosome segregation ATPase
MKNLNIEAFNIKNLFRRQQQRRDPPRDDCRKEREEANNFREAIERYDRQLRDAYDRIRNADDELRTKRNEIEENHRKIELISNLLHQANVDLQLTRQQLSDALIIVAKYNELLPKYNQLLKDYEELQKLYNKTKAELDETKYVLNLNNETMNLLNDINKYNSYENTLEKTIIQEHFAGGFSENFVESWVTISGNSKPAGSYYDENASTTYKNVKLQNNMLKNQIDKVSNIYSADNQRAMYQITNIEFQNNIHGYLLMVYYILLLVLIILFYFDIKNVSRIVKIGVVIAIVLYPWVIYLFEKSIYFIFAYLYSIVNGNVFFNDY